MYQVDFYELPDSKIKPVAEFLKSIEDKKLRAKITRSLFLLQTYGPELREPDSKSLSDGIFELRTIQSNNIVRCLYFFFYGNRIIVTNAFIKKTQKTPVEEIRLAKERKLDFERRIANE